MEQSLLSYIKDELKIEKKDLYSIPYWDRVRLSQMFIQPDDTGSSPKGTLKISNDGRSRWLIIRLDFVYKKHMKYEMILMVINKYDRNGHISAHRYHIDFLRRLGYTYQE